MRAPPTLPSRARGRCSRAVEDGEAGQSRPVEAGTEGCLGGGDPHGGNRLVEVAGAGWI